MCIRDSSNIYRKEEISDHNLLVLSVQMEGVSKKMDKDNVPDGKTDREMFDMKKFMQYLNANEFVMNEVWEVDEMYNNFVNYLKKGMVESTKKIKNCSQRGAVAFSPWIDKEYLAMVNKKEYLFGLQKKFKGNEVIRKDYKACRNALLAMRRRKKAEHFSSFFKDSTNINKNIWKVANEVLYCSNRNRDQKIVIHEGGKEIEDYRTSEVLNDYYATVVDNIKKEYAQKADCEKIEQYVKSLPRSGSEFENIVLDKNEIIKLIDALKNKKIKLLMVLPTH